MNCYRYLDSDNYYVYPNSRVLRNKLGIRDAQKLEEAEHLLVSIRLVKTTGIVLTFIDKKTDSWIDTSLGTAVFIYDGSSRRHTYLISNT